MSLEQELNAILKQDPQVRVAKNFCTFKIGGGLSCLLEVNSTLQLKKILAVIERYQSSYRILGRGSNILFPDQGLVEPVIKLGAKFNSIFKIAENEYAVGAATSLIELSAKTSRLGLSGLEFAGGIPASVGGATLMNAGAYGSQLANIISWVEIVDAEGHEERLSIDELNFSYRSSSIPLGTIVIAIGVKLVNSDPLTTETTRLRYLEERRLKQPLEYPSAGSVFKNPNFERSAGWLLEQVGMKGVIEGGAMFAPKHANWIVNMDGQATAKDVLTLIDIAKKKVASAYKIDLELELKVW